MEVKEDQAREMLERPHTTEVLIENGNYPLSLLRHYFDDGTYLQEAWVTDEEGRPYADYAIGKGAPNKA